MENWQSKLLPDLAEFINGHAFKPSDWSKEGLPIIRIEQLRNPNAPYDFYAGKLPEDKIIENGDLIFSWSASLFLRIWNNGRAALNQHLFKVVNYEGTDRLFLKYLIEFHLPALAKAAHGSTMQHITRKELNQFGVNVPSDEMEQKQIAAILLEADRAIEQTEAMIAKLQHIQTGLMHDLLTRGIDEHGNIRSEEIHEFKDSSLGRVPESWSVSPLGNQFTLQRGFDITQEQQRPGTIPVVSSSGVTSYHDNSMLDGPGVVIGRKGKLGDAYYMEGPYWPHDTTLWVKDFHGNVPRFAAYFLAWLRLERFDAATSVPTLNRNFIHPLIVAVPSPDEQIRIIKILDTTISIINAKSAYQDKLCHLKTGLMQDLLTGKVRVNGLLKAQSNKAEA
jgi:type I restriction enzyme S subunit